MRSLIFRFVVLVSTAMAMLSACIEKEPVEHEIPFINPDIRTDTLRILAIGNSFTVDGTDYVQYLVGKSGIDKKRFCIYTLTEGGTTLSHWVKYFKEGKEFKAKRLTGDIIMPVDYGSPKDIIAQNWDVIVLQQLSNYSDDLDKIEPDLREMKDAITSVCLNPNLAFAWQMTWSYWNKYSTSHPRGEHGWRDIENTVEKIVENTGINHIIPTGTAIQNARSSVLNTEHELTRDGKHLGYGVGQYVAACTWFEYFFTPMFDVSVEGNPLRWKITTYEKGHTIYEAIDVTDDNALLCQQCAKAAIRHRDTITIIE